MNISTQLLGENICQSVAARATAEETLARTSQTPNLFPIAS